MIYLVQGDIRSAIGLAKLLIDERFVQFIELVDQSEFKTGDKPVRCSDLQGFWDMVDFQVIDVKKKFSGLEKLKENNYIEEVVVIKPIKKAKPTVTVSKEVFLLLIILQLHKIKHSLFI
jgi:disks large-associated protein 5